MPKQDLMKVVKDTKLDVRVRAQARKILTLIKFDEYKRKARLN